MGHARLADEPVGTAAAHSVKAHALTVRGIGLAWWEGAPIPVWRAALTRTAHAAAAHNVPPHARAS